MALATFLVAFPGYASHSPTMPEAEHVLVRAEHPERIVVATRFGGHYTSGDGGRTWLNVCHEAVGADDTEPYPGVLTSNSTLVVSTGFRGLASSPDGCEWNQWAPPDVAFIADIAVMSDVGLLALDGGATLGGRNGVWASQDSGLSWSPFGSALPVELTMYDLDASPDGQEVFVTGADATGSVLLRSGDVGATWSSSSLSTAAAVKPRLAGIRREATTVVVVVLAHEGTGGAETPGDAVVVSFDAGLTFRTVFESRHALPAATLADDGTLFFGGPDEGLWRVTTHAGEEPAPERVSSAPTRGLTWSGGRLFSVGHEKTDGYSVAVSSDRGVTFEPFFRLCDAVVTASCAQTSTVVASCSTGIETAAWQPLGGVCSRDAGVPKAPSGVSAGDPAVPAASCAVRRAPLVQGAPRFSLLGLASLVVSLALRRMQRRRRGASDVVDGDCFRLE